MSNRKSSKNLISLGLNNAVVKSKIVAVVAPDAAPIKRLKDEARRNNKLIDATSGRKTRAVIVTESDHIILASIQPETISQRFQ
ncbi:extracellular matrix/biofilm biosynthesis regulator RemA family protein [Candidatus Omnitrophota bacterium]